MDECLFGEQIDEPELCLNVSLSMGALNLVSGLGFCLWKAS